jgi:integrative and conjugative element protein (TIGR02256 family)
MPSESWRYLEPESGLVVSVTPSVLRLFDGSRQRLWQRERGGVLFAESVGTDGRLEIVDATAPHAGDRSGWNWLTLDHQRCLDEISDRFARGLHFVGYWHTHPERMPRPSARDITALQRNLLGGGIPLQKLIAVIVGTDRTAAGLCVATVSRSNSIPSLFVPLPCAGGSLESAQN